MQRKEQSRIHATMPHPAPTGSRAFGKQQTLPQDEPGLLDYRVHSPRNYAARRAGSLCARKGQTEEICQSRLTSIEAASWDENPARMKLAEDVAHAIAQHVPIRSSFDALDIGCGTGLLTLQAKAHFLLAGLEFIEDSPDLYLPVWL